MKALGIILDSGKNSTFGKLTDKRIGVALPICGVFRVIDFGLSNMTNSGIGNVAVITQENSRSITDHLSSSKWWNFGRKQGGLHLLTPSSKENGGIYKGTAHALYQNLGFLEHSKEEYVVIANGSGIYKIDFMDVVKSHIETDADITVVCSKEKEGFDYTQYGNLELDKNNNIINFEEKALDPEWEYISLEIYVIKRELLISLLKEVNEEERYAFVRDVIIRYKKRLKIKGYEFNGHWASVHNIKSYFAVNMALLDENIRKMLLQSSPTIKTKVIDEPLAKYNYNATVINSIVANGSIINSYIESSIISRGVYQSENSSIKNSIVMEGVKIGRNCNIEYAIIDKNVEIDNNKIIIGTEEKPIIIRKGEKV